MMILVIGTSTTRARLIVTWDHLGLRALMNAFLAIQSFGKETQCIPRHPEGSKESNPSDMNPFTHLAK